MRRRDILAWRMVSVRQEAQVFGASSQHQQHRDHHSQHACHRDVEPVLESEFRREEHQERGHEHAAAARAVEGKANGETSLLLEPGRHDGVDRRSTHRRPAERHHDKAGEGLPGRLGESEQGDACSHGAAAHEHDAPGPESLDAISDEDDPRRATEVVKRDG